MLFKLAYLAFWVVCFAAGVHGLLTARREQPDRRGRQLIGFVMLVATAIMIVSMAFSIFNS